MQTCLPNMQSKTCVHEIDNHSQDFEARCRNRQGSKMSNHSDCHNHSHSHSPNYQNCCPKDKLMELRIRTLENHICLSTALNFHVTLQSRLLMIYINHVFPLLPPPYPGLHQNMAYIKPTFANPTLYGGFNYGTQSIPNAFYQPYVHPNLRPFQHHGQHNVSNYAIHPQHLAGQNSQTFRQFQQQQTVHDPQLNHHNNRQHPTQQCEQISMGRISQPTAQFEQSIRSTNTRETSDYCRSTNVYTRTTKNIKIPLGTTSFYR